MRKREATLTLFKSTTGKGSYHGELEVHETIPAGAKLKVHLYEDISARGNPYQKGPVFTPVLQQEAPANAESK